MRIVCSHDEASFLRIMCHKHSECSQCVLSRICQGNLNKLLYTNPKAAALITKNNCQVVSFKEQEQKKPQESTMTYQISVVFDSSGNVIATNQETGETRDISINTISGSNLNDLFW